MDRPQRLVNQAPSGAAPLGYHAFVPDTPRAVPLVIVHGRSGRPGRYFRAFLPSAIGHARPLIVPTFDDVRFQGYQTLAGESGPLAAQSALLATLQAAGEGLRLDTRKVDLLGYSGGAQFVHRHAMTRPESVHRVVVAAAGWYTWLDPGRAFPSGCAAIESSSFAPIDIDHFLDVPVHVLIGERDTERAASLRRTPSLDRRQGPHRLARALSWIDHVEAVAAARGRAAQITFDLLPGCSHSFAEAVRRGDLVGRTAGFLDTPDTSRAAVTGQPHDA